MLYYSIMNKMIKTLLSQLHTLTDQDSDRILFSCGVFLSAAELYKQFFLFYVIYHQSYDWWFFPFQLCSLPMYFCLLLPFLPSGRIKTTLCTFMQDYGLLGGIAALIVPEGFRHIHWTLTLHGYVWHILLILISLFLLFTGRSDVSRRNFTDTVPLFAACCCIATAVNVLTPGRGSADMFYISPYTPGTQPVFRELALYLGILPANLLYLLTILTGSAILHILLGHIQKSAEKDPSARLSDT